MFESEARYNPHSETQPTLDMSEPDTDRQLDGPLRALKDQLVAAAERLQLADERRINDQSAVERIQDYYQGDIPLGSDGSEMTEIWFRKES